jgi:hypothetical protein
MAGMLSCIAGTVSMRYYLATILTGFFVIPLAVSLSFPVWVNKLNIVTRNLRFPSLSIILIIYTSVIIINIIPVYVLVTDISANKVFWVQEFNGWLPNKWKHSIQIARDINRQLQAYPANRANLVVESCQAQLFASVDEFAFNRRLTSANISNANWHNGIAKLCELVALSHN